MNPLWLRGEVVFGRGAVEVEETVEIVGEPGGGLEFVGDEQGELTEDGFGKKAVLPR